MPNMDDSFIYASEVHCITKYQPTCNVVDMSSGFPVATPETVNLLQPSRMSSLTAPHFRGTPVYAYGVYGDYAGKLLFAFRSLRKAAQFFGVHHKRIVDYISTGLPFF